MSPEETLHWAVSTLIPQQAIASTPSDAGAAGPEEIGPTDFERRAGRGQSKKWKESVKLYGQPGMSIGRWLAEQGAPVPVRSPCQRAWLSLSISTQRIRNALRARHARDGPAHCYAFLQGVLQDVLGIQGAASCTSLPLHLGMHMGNLD